MSGSFISFEGIDGSGKTTQAQRLVALLHSAGRRVVAVREPGSTLLAERVRTLLLDPEMGGVSSRAELLLYVACRAELVETTIRPALAAGKIVVSDRYSDSTIAYQGYGRELGADLTRQADLVATSGLRPDVTFLLDVPVKAAMERLRAVAPDRLESESRAFHERTRRGFLEVAERHPDRVVVVDGLLSPDEITGQIVERLTHLLPGLLSG